MDSLLPSDIYSTKTLEKELTKLARLNRTIGEYFKKLGTPKDTTKLRHEQQINLKKKCEQIKESVHEAITLSQRVNANLSDMMIDDNSLAAEKLKKSFGEEVLKLQKIVEQIQIKEQQFQPQVVADTPYNDSYNFFHVKQNKQINE
ncbi:hypothetical protein RFI_15450 [Reticulomyxa filosa]|uniref:Syntaxin N-terminal domain-containing protein n=1 Tax=Reticulomyxa filosa TaxID=46433 RepID=X6N7M1_RETFI|nr:hypothetical protein RFI_15450 [Reticulomyxa filosa]|eukprot:ETO21754.1 hypothetical protein RFI_15450 [Reticulomyxa filosa]